MEFFVLPQNRRDAFPDLRLAQKAKDASVRDWASAQKTLLKVRKKIHGCFSAHERGEPSVLAWLDSRTYKVGVERGIELAGLYVPEAKLLSALITASWQSRVKLACMTDLSAFEERVLLEIKKRQAISDCGPWPFVPGNAGAAEAGRHLKEAVIPLLWVSEDTALKEEDRPHFCLGALNLEYRCHNEILFSFPPEEWDAAVFGLYCLAIEEAHRNRLLSVLACLVRQAVKHENRRIFQQNLEAGKRLPR